ncbi:MAG: DNA phosphorothioation-associated putative methyltransferase, partial [Sphaerospermopsis sp. SIO1G2]|nr:DNA phosphorothioation-associated putative methyltransferase [Sphaerospermopsis sp. SIO1G2]
MNTTFTPNHSLSHLSDIFPTPSQISLNAIATRCYNSKYGKLLPDAFYIHILALHTLDIQLQHYESLAKSVLPQYEKITIVKFSISKPKISYLYYPDFDTDPHPALQSSIQVDVQSFSFGYRDYSDTENPPILHRKETFVTPEYPHYQEFVELTRAQDALGLLNNTKGIGTKLGWEKRLQLYGVEIQGHKLIQKTINPVSENPENFIPKIERHKAAIIRHDFSRPLRLALDAGLFTSNTTFFDYGCGHGGDMKRIANLGYSSNGWDPYYLSDHILIPADIVNLGFVINVIENQSERREALIKAWELTTRVLIVSAQVLISDSQKGIMAYGDGVITKRNTFQKYYEQEELKTYIDQVLGVDAIPAALGVYFVFRDPAAVELYRISRFRSRSTTPRVRACIKKFEEHKELLTPVMDFMTERGRIPT